VIDTKVSQFQIVKTIWLLNHLLRESAVEPKNKEHSVEMPNPGLISHKSHVAQTLILAVQHNEHTLKHNNPVNNPVNNSINNPVSQSYLETV
jgi:hypothetical protein